MEFGTHAATASICSDLISLLGSCWADLVPVLLKGFFYDMIFLEILNLWEWVCGRGCCYLCCCFFLGVSSFVQELQIRCCEWVCGLRHPIESQSSCEWSDTGIQGGALVLDHSGIIGGAFVPRRDGGQLDSKQHGCGRWKRAWIWRDDQHHQRRHRMRTIQYCSFQSHHLLPAFLLPVECQSWL